VKPGDFLQQHRQPLVVAGALAALVIACLDKWSAGAGMWMLLGLSITTGFAHGALDMELLLQRFSPLSSAMRLACLYLAAVVFSAWALSGAPQTALWLLLLMSVWHFGEDFGRWAGASTATGVLTRLVVGGAPVMMPFLFSAHAMNALLAEVWSGELARFWLLLAQVWLVLLLLWMAVCGLRLRKPMRHAWFELAGVAALNLILSPMMAFALYFGAYHAPVHIRRVWTKRPAAGPARAFSRMNWSVIFAGTLALGAALWWAMGRTETVASTDLSFALRWLVLALTALTVPHLVLVSLCARALSSPAESGETPANESGPALTVEQQAAFDSGLVARTNP
jgi:beta-carotene 15,15'-dioxygenase